MAVININTEFDVDEQCYLIWNNQLALADVKEIVIKRTTGPVNEVVYFIQIGPALLTKEFTEAELFPTIAALKAAL